MSETIGSLVTKMGSWIPGLTGMLTSEDDAYTFINIAMNKLETEYNFNAMRQNTSDAVSAGDAGFPLAVPSPYKYKELFRAFFIDANGKRYPLAKTSFLEGRSKYPDSTVQGTPVEVSIEYNGIAELNTVSLFPAPDVAGTVELYFYAFTNPSYTSQTGLGAANYLTNGPWQVLLYGALAEAADYLRDFDGMKAWIGKRDDAARKYIDAEQRERTAGSYRHMKTPYAIGGKTRGR